MNSNITVKEMQKTYNRYVWQTNSYEDFTEDLKLFTLQAKNTTYALAALESGHIVHVYFGKKTEDEDLTYLLRLEQNPWTLKVNARDAGTFMDARPFEYPCHGKGDYREPCLMVMDKAGMSTCDLRYVSHKIYGGKPALETEGMMMPATFANENEATTLEITCIDKVSGLEAVLVYTAFKDLDVITRNVRLKNTGADAINIRRVLSACVDFEFCNYDMITLNGSWARERCIERAPLHHGKQGVYHKFIICPGKRQ